jgi:hypothetical protein
LRKALKGAGLTVDSSVGWSDEFRIGLYGSTRKVLAPRGVKVRQRVELVRDWYHLAVVVAPRTGDLAWAWVEGTKGSQIAPAVRKWRKSGIDGLVWDGMPGHMASEVRATGMALVRQPALSPELNPAERIGEAVRAKVEGKVYGSIWQKMAAVEECLRELAANPERVRKMTGWAWIRGALRRLPWKKSRGE